MRNTKIDYSISLAPNAKGFTTKSFRLIEEEWNEFKNLPNTLININRKRTLFYDGNARRAQNPSRANRVVADDEKTPQNTFLI